ncbi:MAG TPA: PsiF family protein, partial [Nitrococcus sp.]|nr:PsiF family protein [Nitrococcus sp.]
ESNTHHRTPQQQRMAECSHKSKGLKGEEHKKFMSECLKGHKTTAAAASSTHTGKKSTQQEKMKACNAEAKSKKLSGTERKHFMSQCLKG